MVNLGAEGQLYIGAILGSLAGSHIHGLPPVIHILFVLLCGFIGGALWGLIVAVLKMKFGASELITTIMLNYIALEFVSFCVTNPPFRDATPGAAPRMPSVVDAVKLPIILPQTRLHLGIIFALIAVLIYYVFMWKTTRGYEMRVIGMNPNAGRYSGMNIPVNSILSMFLAGGFAVLAVLSILSACSTSLQRAFPITLASAVLQWPFLAAAARWGSSYRVFCSEPSMQEV